MKPRALSGSVVRLFGGAALAAALAPAAAAHGQEPMDVRSEVFAGSELEGYLRTLQVTGRAAAYPWSVRSFSPREVERVMAGDSAHPWEDRFRLSGEREGRVRWVRPQAQALLNTTRPWGGNDGAIWAGRGVTAAVEGGVAAEWGPVSLVVNPVLFVAQNAGFELESNGLRGDEAFGDGRRASNIDLPQRFGDGPYARIDGGQSTLRVDAGPFAAAVSTANQVWGPAGELPLVLGHNAAGFPHLWVGTSRPANLWVGRVHGRLVYGLLDHTTYIAATRRRFMSGGIGVFVPRGLPTLEVGATRFFNTPYPEDGITFENFKKPLEGFLKNNLPGRGVIDGKDGDVDNQLASIFFRWHHPRNGFEVYGEYAREDHNADARDVALEPDQNAGFMLGLRRVWARDDGSLVSLNAETLNTRVSHLDPVRPQTPFYVHTGTRQGHTLRGQLLAAPSGYAGSGAVVSVDRYTRRGRASIVYNRVVRQGRTLPLPATGEEIQPEPMHALGVEVLRFSGRLDLTGGVNASYHMDRRGGDYFNLNSVLRVRVGL